MYREGRTVYIITILVWIGIHIVAPLIRRKILVSPAYLFEPNLKKDNYTWAFCVEDKKSYFTWMCCDVLGP